MADYWKSQPKHFCKFCKCWIADNKASRDFHEKGKRHQENVERKISEVRKSAVTKAKQEEEENSYMLEMERNARKAFMKDVKKNPALAAEIKKKKEPPKLRDKKEEKPQNVAGGQNDSNQETGTWHVAFSDEGYPYYWNDITSEVSWVKPKGYVEKKSEVDIEVPAEYDSSTAEQSSSTAEQSSSTAEQSSSTAEQSSSTAEAEEEHHETAEEPQPDEQPPPPGIDDLSSIPLPTKDIPLPGSSTSISKRDEEKDEQPAPKQKEATKRAHSAAYGSWEQVKEEEKYVDLQLPEQETTVEQKVIVVSEPKMKFKEKKINSLGADLIAFKKRKQANRSIKQRTTDT